MRLLRLWLLNAQNISNHPSLTKRNTMDYTETNKLIAEFMGAKLSGGDETFDFLGIQPSNEFFQFWHVTQLKYHTSWDWLMPVVEKIEKERHVIKQESFSVEYWWDVKIERNFCIIKPDYAMVLALGVPAHFSSYNGKLIGTYETVVQFINWYNSNK